MALTDPIRRLGEWFAELSLRYVPDPYVLVILLTFLSILSAFLVGAGPLEVFNAWNEGVWTLLVFMAQFSITLMAGDAIAKSPTVTRLLSRIGQLPNSPFTAVWATAVVAMISGLISWGLGLITGAVMAQQVAYWGKRRGIKLHYPLLIAAGYTALMIWHSGLTTSSGLIMADPAAIPDTFPEYARGGLSLGETIGSTVNIVTAALLLLVVPPVMAALHPTDDENIREIPEAVVEKMTLVEDLGTASAGGTEATADGGTTTEQTIADRVNHSKVLGLIIAILPLYYFFSEASGGLESLTLDGINAGFLFLAIVLWVTPARIVEQMDDSVTNVAGIIFQFPFYAGISGILTGTALGVAIANTFANIATPLTWPVLGLISAGIVNIFVPSGGGQWVAQGPILLETTRQLGMPLYTAVVIEMMGDQLTNMIQPFWALPALALANLRARDILGYTTVAMLAAFVIMAITMTLFLGMGF